MRLQVQYFLAAAAGDQDGGDCHSYHPFYMFIFHLLSVLNGY